MPVLHSLHQLWEGMLDLVYPPHCLICERYGSAVICETCYGAFSPLPEPVCDVCGRPHEEENLPCRLCEMATAAGGWGFAGARAASIYYGPLRHAIHRLKFQNVELLGPPLGAHLANRCVVEELLPPTWQKAIDIVVPVPLQRARERRRGFNQAALLAAPLAEMMGAPLSTDIIRRARNIPPQVGLSGAERRRNITPENFAIVHPDRIVGKGILIVDDVFTTGATVSACAVALCQAGAGPIYAVTLAAGG